MVTLVSATDHMVLAAICRHFSLTTLSGFPLPSVSLPADAPLSLQGRKRAADVEDGSRGQKAGRRRRDERAEQLGHAYATTRRRASWWAAAAQCSLTGARKTLASRCDSHTDKQQSALTENFTVEQTRQVLRQEREKQETQSGPSPPRYKSIPASPHGSG